MLVAARWWAKQQTEVLVQRSQRKQVEKLYVGSVAVTVVGGNKKMVLKY